MKILIVETETNKQRQLRTILTSLGHKSADIEIAVDSRQALSLLRKKRYDCCFVVSGAEGLDAMELLKTIRSGSMSKTLPVVLYSSEVTKERVMEAHESGSSGFLAYPFSVSDVEGALQRALLKAK